MWNQLSPEFKPHLFRQQEGKGAAFSKWVLCDITYSTDLGVYLFSDKDLRVGHIKCFVGLPC